MQKSLEDRTCALDGTLFRFEEWIYSSLKDNCFYPAWLGEWNEWAHHHLNAHQQLLTEEAEHDIIPQNHERDELMIHLNFMLTLQGLLNLACLYLTKI